MKQFFEGLAELLIVGLIAVCILIAIVLSGFGLTGTSIGAIQSGIAGCSAWLAVIVLTLLWKLK
jgi:hypothetical protein